MQTSTELSAIAEALAKAQGTMGAAVKDADNPFFRSRYADLASVWEACRGPLSANGLSVIQFPSTAYQGEPVPYEWTARGSGEVRHGVRIACIVSVLTRLLHTSGQWMEETVSTMLPTGDPQAVGSAITYLRRYALQSVAGVAPDDDDAEGAQQGPGGPRNSDRPAQARPAFVPVGTAQPTAQAAPGTTTVQNVTQKKGASAKGPWTRYFVKFADGREGVTFSATLGTEAEVAQQSGAPVNPEIVKTDKGSDLKGWQPVAITSAPAPEPHVPDEPVDGPEKVLTVREIKTDRGSRWVIQTAKRQLITDKHEHAEMAVEARGAGIGIVPTYDVVASPSGGAPANRLTSLLCEVAPPAEREPGAEG